MGIAFPLGFMKKAAAAGPITVTLVQRAASPNGGPVIATVTGVLPPVGRQMIAIVTYRRGNSANEVPLATISNTGPAITWTQIADNNKSGVAPSIRETWWVATAPPGSTPYDITVTTTLGAQIALTLLSLNDQAASDFTNFGNGNSVTGDPAATLPTTPAATSVTIAAAAVTLDEAAPSPPPATFLTTPTGYTNLDNFTQTNGTSVNPMASQIVYDPSTPSNTIAWSSAAFAGVATLMEIKHV